MGAPCGVDREELFVEEAAERSAAARHTLGARSSNNGLAATDRGRRTRSAGFTGIDGEEREASEARIVIQAADIEIGRAARLPGFYAWIAE